VCEFRIRSRRHVALHLMPVVLVVANSFAVDANGQQTVKLLDLRQCVLKFPDTIAQFHFQVNEPLADLEPRA
jgi:hypothetical protein